jgi:hypothetical protein
MKCVLKAKNDIEEIDRFSLEIADQRYIGRDGVGIDAECFDQTISDGVKDFIAI